MKQKFFKNLFFVVGLNLLIKPFWVFGVDRVVQNSVGSEQYGLYFTLFNLSVLFNIILDFGLTNFNNRNISQNSQLLPKFFPNIIILKSLLFLFYSLITVSIGFAIGYNFEIIKLLIILTINQFLLSSILFIRSNISGLQYYKTDSVVSVLDRLLMIIFVGILIISVKYNKCLDIWTFALMQTLAYTITFIFALLFLFKKIPKISFRFNKVLIISILKNTLPYTLLIFLMSFYNRIDAILLERILPNGHLHSGVYAQSFRILDAFSQFSLLFAGLLLPMFSKMLKQKESVTELTNFSFLIIILPTLVVSVTSCFYHNQIISLLYKDNIEYSSSIFKILFFSTIPISTSYIFGTLLTANGNLKYFNIISLLGLIFNVTLNLILIPSQKAVGSAIASVSTQFLVSIIQIILVSKILNVKIYYKNFVKIITFTLILVVINILFMFINFKWIFEYFIILFIGVALALSLKLINIKKAIKLLIK